jgi:tight adherence protein C
MNLLLNLAIATTIFAAVGLIALTVFSRKPHAATQRATQIANRNKVIEVTDRNRQLRQQIVLMVNEIRARLGISVTDKLRDRLSSAGFMTASDIETYLAARLLAPVIAIAIGSFIPSHRVFWMMSLGGIAYLAPDIILGRIAKRRRKKILKGVPDAIDLLVICVDAGLGMDQAMLRVAQELTVSHPEINDEFLHISREQRAGKLRIEAWKSMAERTKLPEIEDFVNMLMQTERFGTPIARALSNYADSIRMKRRQTAEQKAAKTTVKIIFPLVLFIFPSMFIVLLGPAVIGIMRGLLNGTQ